MGHEDLIERMEMIVGREACLRDSEACARYLVDWRGMYEGRTLAVVRPGSTQEVSEVLHLCHLAGVPVVPHGGNTGLVGGAIPSAEGDEIVLSLERLNRVREIDTFNYTMTVEAGCVLQAVQEAALEADRYFPLSLGAEGTCQIGGNLATNAGGNAVLRFGNARDLVLGLEVVLPDGRVWDGLRGLRKSNAGYDLKHLFLGAEGTLGVITAATLKLFPARRQVETAFLALDSLEKAITLFASARENLDEFLSAFELIPRIGIDMAIEHVPETRDPLSDTYPYYVLMQTSTSQTFLPLRDMLEDWLGKAIESGDVADGVMANSQQHAQSLWLIREACVEAQRRAGPSIKHDVSVPISRVPAFIKKGTTVIESEMRETRVVAFGHIGDGNIHFNVCVGEGQDHEAFRALGPQISKLVYDVVASFGGSFSAEHGIGRLRRGALYNYVGGVEMDIMQDIKDTLDPDNTMNPGKVFCETRTKDGVRGVEETFEAKG